jgi:hypothetical protein
MASLKTLQYYVVNDYIVCWPVNFNDVKTI